jgi:transcriptional regulator with XRE-family HTH domain
MSERLPAILERLAQARIHAGLTQAQVAKLIDLDTGGAISHYEGGQRKLTLETFLRMCELYGASEMWVLTGVNPDFDPQPAIEALERMKASRDDVDKILETLSMVKVNE